MKRILLIILVGLSSLQIIAQDGSFDETFGTDGRILHSFSEYDTYARHMITLSGGNFLITGFTSNHSSSADNSGYISKHLPNGELDMTYGTDGVILFPYGNNGGSGMGGMTRLFDGKILLSGRINATSVIIRLNRDGTFDTTFGDNGIVYPIWPGALGVQSDGRIISFSGFYDGFNLLYSCSRYYPDGSLDTSFGDNGTIITDITQYRFDYSTAMVIQPDNKIVVVGRSYDSVYGYAVVSRFNSNGTRDTEFGTNGVQITPIGESPGHGFYNDVAIKDGKIIAVGGREYSGGTGGFGGEQSAIVKYNYDGTLDSTFGIDGQVLLDPIFNANDRINATLIQPEGEILVAGISSFPFPETKTYINISRLDTDGNLDPGFGNNGVFLTDAFGSSTNGAYEMAFQHDGKILVAGTSKAEFFNALIFRLNNDIIFGTEDSSKPELFIFPNPVINLLKIRAVDIINSVSISDVLGQEVSRLNVEALETTVDMSRFTAGVYFVKVSFGNKNLIKKLIKK